MASVLPRLLRAPPSKSPLPTLARRACLFLSLYPVSCSVPILPRLHPPVKWHRPSLHDPRLLEGLLLMRGVGAALTLEPIPESVGMGSLCSVRGPLPSPHPLPFVLSQMRWRICVHAAEEAIPPGVPQPYLHPSPPLLSLRALFWPHPARVHPSQPTVHVDLGCDVLKKIF